MKLSIQAGATSQTVNVFIQDSSSATGAGLAGLVYNSAGLTAYYALPRAASAAITLATLAAVTSAYSSGGFKEIDATNMPGWYRFDIPDAALASGRFVSIHLKGATNMAPLPVEIELTAWNNQDAVRGGMTALPNAAAEAAGGLYTRGTGAGQINQDANGRIDANVKTWISGAIPAVNVTGVPKVDIVDWLGSAPNALIQGKVDITSSIRSSTAQAGAAGSITLDASASATDDLYKGAWLVILAATGAGQARLITGYTGATKVATVAPNWATNPDNTSVFVVIPAAGVDVELWKAAVAPAMTGDAYARLGAPAGASVSADIAAVKSDSAAVKTQTDKMTFTVANQIDANVLDWKSATAPAMTGDAFARMGAPAGASVSADVAAVKADSAAIKTKTDSLTFTVANQVDSNVLDWKSATAPAMTGDAYARLGAPAGASVSADVAAVKSDSAGVKAKTDSLTFTVANQVDSNVLDWKSATAPAMPANFASFSIDASGRVTLVPSQIVVKKNVARAKFPFFMVDSSDHITPKTGLTITATRSLDGAAFGACANSAVEVASGWYYIDLAAADLNADTVALKFTAAGADARNISILTQP